jgi:hypothetical protein
MERNFANENMEEFLRRSTDGLSMRPSAKVWKGISSHLNKRRRRLGFILGTSVLFTTALGYFLINESSRNYSTVPTNTAFSTKQNLKSGTLPQLSNEAIAPNKPLRSYGDKDHSTNDFRVIAFDPSADKKLNFTQTLLQETEQVAQNTFSPTIVDSYLADEWHPEKESNSIEEVIPSNPLSIESVLNSYRPRTKKLGWQFYFTPTLSYRNVNDNKINDIVPHKPAFGFELGTAAKYPISKNTKLRAGVQFNVNRYEIKTWDSYAQFATIKLVDGNKVGYVTKITNYNNLSGYQTNWLQNFFLQVSTPIGVEVKLSGDEKVQFGMASTVQPTYLLGDKAYLISADYRNYIEEPNLVRRWNVNTSLETFVAYSTGHLNWQVGPQVRYQVLSSYLKKYPVKEHLFDFGFKIGISANK